MSSQFDTSTELQEEGDRVDHDGENLEPIVGTVRVKDVTVRRRIVTEAPGRRMSICHVAQRPGASEPVADMFAGAAR